MKNHANGWNQARAARVQAVAAERIRKHKRVRSCLVRQRTKVFVRTAIGGAEALSDNATRIMMVVAVVHTCLVQKSGAASSSMREGASSVAIVCR